MYSIFNLEIIFEHTVWRILSDLEIPFRKFNLEKDYTVHVIIEDKYTERVAEIFKNLRITT